MFARILSTILIAAVIACPLSCYSGMCLLEGCVAPQRNSSLDASNHCCQKTPTSPDSTSPDSTSPDSTSPDSTSPDSGNKQIPDRCPMQTCQGVCGGAVFERPIEIELLGGAFSWPFGDTLSFALAGMTVETASPRAAEPPWCFGDVNVGRSLCTKHMLFQC